MDDREKLGELLDDTVGYTLDETVDHLIANGVVVQRWIPVTERLPEPLENVLVYDGTAKRIESAYMTRHKEWVGVVIKNEVTHWMPLPEPPKEVKSR